MKDDKDIKLVLDILNDEMKGDTASAMQKLSDTYSMTWVYKNKKGILFPRSIPDFKKQMEDVYQIKDRKYNIKNIGKGDGVVFVEMIESYSDPETKQKYVTPLVLVLEVKDGKIQKGRHYCDPQISYLELSEKEIDGIY